MRKIINKLLAKIKAVPFSVVVPVTTEGNMDNNESKVNDPGIFKLVPASQLSLEDRWMKYQPKTNAEREFKELVETAIKKGLKDFWRPVCDPSFNYKTFRVCYKLGWMPAVERDYYWWKRRAKNFLPESGSRLGTKSEYIAFLATLIKELVASGKSLEWAWNAVCNDSKELGNYWIYKDGKHYIEIETAGSREICGWYDLANTRKILAKDEEADGFEYWLAGGDYRSHSYDRPLAEFSLWDYRDACLKEVCGWLVFDSCPDC